MNKKLIERINKLDNYYLKKDKLISLEMLYLKISFYENKLYNIYKNEPYKFKCKEYNNEILKYQNILKELYLKIEENL